MSHTTPKIIVTPKLTLMSESEEAGTKKPPQMKALMALRSISNEPLEPSAPARCSAEVLQVDE